MNSLWWKSVHDSTSAQSTESDSDHSSTENLKSNKKKRRNSDTVLPLEFSNTNKLRSKKQKKLKLTDGDLLDMENISMSKRKVRDMMETQDPSGALMDLSTHLQKASQALASESLELCTNFDRRTRSFIDVISDFLTKQSEHRDQDQSAREELIKMIEGFSDRSRAVLESACKLVEVVDGKVERCLECVENMSEEVSGIKSMIDLVVSNQEKINAKITESHEYKYEEEYGPEQNDTTLIEEDSLFSPSRRLLMSDD